MVVYDLICHENHRFEGWFPSFESYQEQAARGQISCPSCGTRDVEKLPHACAVHLKKETPKPQPPTEKPRAQPISKADIKEFLLRIHHYVRDNFEDVGPQFAEEARKIFHGEADQRPIHGSATPQERVEMDEDGIPYVVLPKPDLDS